MTPRRATKSDMAAILDIWLRSVRATHAFLTDDDIAALAPQIEPALAGMDVWIIDMDGAPAGFMAMHGATIEALFIDPDRMGTGLGTKFVEHAAGLAGPGSEIRVDVNEANPDAHRFYLSRGFKPVGRSETDRAGRPWPLVHLAMRG